MLLLIKPFLPKNFSKSYFHFYSGWWVLDRIALLPLKVTSCSVSSLLPTVLPFLPLKWQTCSILVLIVYNFRIFLFLFFSNQHKLSISQVFRLPVNFFRWQFVLSLKYQIIFFLLHLIFRSKEPTWPVSVFFESWHLKSYCPVLHAVQHLRGFSLLCGDAIGSCLPQSAASG